jgi:proteasome lid subunit RPN8/RPN11
VEHAGAPIRYRVRAGPLESIRIAVSEAFFSVPRGGAEIGGILLGKWELGRLTISSYKPLDCEHAFGPSFTVSPRDRAQLTELITSINASCEQVAGWYHSLTRSHTFLSEADRRIHREFFPEPRQVALVLRPDTLLSTRAGFFFRDVGGTMRTESPCLEFSVEPLEPKPASDAAQGLAGRRLQEKRQWTRRSHSRDSDPVASQSLARSTDTTNAEALARFLDPQPPAPRRFPKILIPLFKAAMVCAAASSKRDLWIPRAMANTRPAQPAVQQSAAPAPTPGLNTVDLDGQYQIRWNRDSPAVAHATDGVLRVKGGAPSAEQIALDRDHLLSGVFTVARQSERVDVSLQLNQPAGQAVREVTSFIGNCPRPNRRCRKPPPCTPSKMTWRTM